MLDDTETVCETIALAIGLNEGTVDLDEGAEHLSEAGTDVETINVVTSALAKVGGSAVATAEVSGDLEMGAGGSDDIDRL